MTPWKLFRNSVGKLTPFFAAMALAAWAAASLGQEPSGVQLQPQHPEQYTVVEGDTLWDIAGVFLRDPWYWPEIWQVNPQIQNPHLIYPGDLLVLSYDGAGRPQIRVERGSAVRLSPRVREEPLEQAIPTIPYEKIAAFLAKPAILTKEQAETAPYILTTREGHLVASTGIEVYVRGAPDAPVGQRFSVIHVGEALKDPDDRKVIGFEGIYVGEGEVLRQGDPTTVILTETDREALEGDRLFPEVTEVALNFIPRPPAQPVDGQIISVIDGVSVIGQYQIVAVNRGANHGLEPGNVMTIYRSGETVRDKVAYKGTGKKVRLPDEPVGTLMVFQTFDRVSYALIMRALFPVRVLDSVRNPS